MKAQIEHHGTKYEVDLGKPIDISYPLVPGSNTPKCFWAPDVSAEAVVAGDFIGSTAKGSPVNFYNVHINPHGNGTHTECVGHIAAHQHSVQESFNQYHFIAKLVTISPAIEANGDRVITPDQINHVLGNEKYDALIIRTSPNDFHDKNIDYSDTNPPYLNPMCMQHICDKGIKHLLIDLPSVDREKDDGLLSAHKAYWDYPNILDDKKSITELVYIDNEVKDNLYLLEMQIAPLVLDASPSRPVLYSLRKI